MLPLQGRAELQVSTGERGLPTSLKECGASDKSREVLYLHDSEGVFKGHSASKDKGRVLSKAQPRCRGTRLYSFRLSGTELFNSCETRDEQRWLRVDRVVQRLFRTLVSPNQRISRKRQRCAS
jgi:hypothetical protein